MTTNKIVRLNELKEVMKQVKDRWNQMGLDCKVFFDEVLMNIEIEEIGEGK